MHDIAVMPLLSWGLLAGWLMGCQSSAPSPVVDPPLPPREPIGLQIQRACPHLQGQPFRVLLDFESPADLAFITGEPAAHLENRTAHTGSACLALPSSSGGFQVKLASLLASETFPGRWTLVGGYFYCTQPALVSVEYPAGPRGVLRRTVRLIPQTWTPVLLDLWPLCDPNLPLPRPTPNLVFRISQNHAAPVLCDDILVIDNTRCLAQSGGAGDGWSVRLHGMTTTVDRQGFFRIDVSTPDAGDDGWQLIEANSLRVVFTSRRPDHWWTIYSDGRQYLDGKFVSLIPKDALNPLLAQEHQTPADLSVPPELGRVQRNHPGDKNNDGYAEMIGSYELQATDPMLFEVTITPRTPSLVHPVLEVSRLAPGNVVVSMDEQSVDKVVRLPDGTVLVQLPGMIQRPVTVHFRVQ
jgi:hypothetical protein